MKDCALLTGAACLVAVILWPFQNTAFIDDWAYAWPVQHLLETSQLRVPQLSGNPNVSQILWGALYCLPFGFSFTALRASTWTLAIASVCAVYLLLRDLGAPRRVGLLGAAVVGVYPIFFVLSATFMTDVPFLAAALWSVLLFARALERRQPGLVWAASALSCAAVGMRIVGVGIAGAFLVTLVFHTGRWGRRPSLWIAPALVAPFTWALLFWTKTHDLPLTQVDWGLGSTQRLSQLRDSLSIAPQMFVVAVLFVAALLGFALLPLAIGSLSRRVAKRAGYLMALFAGIWIAGTYGGLEFWFPLAPGETWAIDELGATAALVPEWHGATTLQPWAARLTMTVGLVLASVLLAAFPWREFTEREKLLMWIVVGQFTLAVMLWLTYDRYGLIFVPLAVVLFLARQRTIRFGPTAVAVVLVGMLSMVGMRDHLAYNQALWNAVAELREQGISVSDIDAGYVVNGWLQYAHPEQAHRGPDGQIAIPPTKSRTTLAYTVANGPRAGATVLKTIPYSGWLRRSGHLYILRDLDVAAPRLPSVHRPSE